MSAGDAKPVYIATGAYSVGKTTTLNWLEQVHGLRVHPEAHGQAVSALGSRSYGHPPDQAFHRLEDPNHMCPMCNPREFCGMVIDIQHRTEREARTGDFLERGVFDAIEFYLRNSGASGEAIVPKGPGSDLMDPGWEPAAPYAKVYLFEVMPELQQQKWGKDRDQRVREALFIQDRLDQMYRSRGYDICLIRAGTVAERARQILATL